MSMYTMPLRAYIEKWSQYDDDLSLNERIEIGRKHLFDFDYPIFDPDYKKIFETNFIKHFYMREIGYETEGLFKLQLENWLNINMPYFNKLFESELLEFDPFMNTKVNVEHQKYNDRQQQDLRNKTQNDTTTNTRNDEANVNENSHTEGESFGTSLNSSEGKVEHDNFKRDLESDTPDSRLHITTQDGEGVIEYASKIKEDSENNTAKSDSTNRVKSKDNSEVDSNTTRNENLNRVENGDLESNINDKLDSTINDIEDFAQVRIGKIGVQSYSKMLNEFRTTFLRIERDIHKEMSVLFMLVY